MIFFDQSVEVIEKGLATGVLDEFDEGFGAHFGGFEGLIGEWGSGTVGEVIIREIDETGDDVEGFFGILPII